MKKILLASAAALTLAACGGDGPAASPEDINAALTQLSLRDSVQAAWSLKTALKAAMTLCSAMS